MLQGSVQADVVVIAEGQHRACLCRSGAGRRGAVRVDGPTSRQQLAGPAIQFDPAAGGNGGGEIEDARVGALARPSECEGVGTQQWAPATCRGNGRIAGAYGKDGNPFFRESFYLRPECRQMDALVDEKHDPCGQRRSRMISGMR